MLFSLEGRRVELRGANHYIAPTAVLIGTVILEDSSSVWFGVVARGDNEPIAIGPRSNVQDGTVLHTDAGIPLTLGADVTVGHQAMLHGCTVGDGSLIGIKAVVLNRAVIGRECLIGANALIPEGKVDPRPLAGSRQPGQGGPHPHRRRRGATARRRAELCRERAPLSRGPGARRPWLTAAGRPANRRPADRRPAGRGGTPGESAAARHRIQRLSPPAVGRP